ELPDEIYEDASALWRAMGRATGFNTERALIASAHRSVRTSNRLLRVVVVRQLEWMPGPQKQLPDGGGFDCGDLTVDRRAGTRLSSNPYRKGGAAGGGQGGYGAHVDCARTS